MLSFVRDNVAEMCCEFPVRAEIRGSLSTEALGTTPASRKACTVLQLKNKDISLVLLTLY